MLQLISVPHRRKSRRMYNQNLRLHITGKLKQLPLTPVFKFDFIVKHLNQIKQIKWTSINLILSKEINFNQMKWSSIELHSIKLIWSNEIILHQITWIIIIILSYYLIIKHLNQIILLKSNHF